jgi:two-component system LytT family sensor kinase
MELPLDLITYSIVVVVVMVIERSRSARDREVQLARLQEQLQRTRLAQLQGQLRPHFLFNALNTVSSVMYLDVSRADRVLQALADILRRMVDQSEAVVIPLREELDLVAAMVEIMEARFGDRLAVRQHVQDGVGDWPVPPLLLQPIVENAIQHAMPEGDGRLEVLVSATSSQGRLRLEVSDNGPGIRNGSRPGEGRGVGLRNTRERLATHFGDEGLFELSTGEQGGLHVVMEVPWTESVR